MEDKEGRRRRLATRPNESPLQTASSFRFPYPAGFIWIAEGPATFLIRYSLNRSPRLQKQWKLLSLGVSVFNFCLGCYVAS